VPRWPNEPVPSGRLEEPKFVRGDFDPLKISAGGNVRQPPTASVWYRHVELCRQNPARWNPATGKFDGGWALISEIKKGGPRARRDAIRRDKVNVQEFVKRHWPLEWWESRIITIPETWCDKQLYLRYLGVRTPEEVALEAKVRSERYTAIMAKAVENKARRAAKAREKAARDELANRQLIRNRRPKRA